MPNDILSLQHLRPWTALLACRAAARRQRKAANERYQQSEPGRDAHRRPAAVSGDARASSGDRSSYPFDRGPDPYRPGALGVPMHCLWSEQPLD